MTRLRRSAQQVLGWVDAWYCRHHRLRRFGPVLYLGRARYRGPELRFEDGTLLRDQDPIGRLHFNNASIAALGEGSLHRVGLRFARLMRQSLHALAEAVQSDPALQDISVFQGLTWIPAHGEGVGFISSPLPRTWRTRLLAGHFRLLTRVFAPAQRIRAFARAEPRLYWLTRAALKSNLSKLKRGHAGETEQVHRSSNDADGQLSAGRTRESAKG